MKVLVRVVLGYHHLRSTKFVSSGSAVCVVISCTDLGWGDGGVLGSQVGSLGTCSLRLLTIWPFALQHHLRL